MTQDSTETTSAPRSVETAWTEALQAELPLNEDSEAVRKYPNFLFGNPLFIMTDIDPDAAVVLVDHLLDRHPPMAFFEVEGALSASEWAALKETLVKYVSEGVQGKRPGPASAFPHATHGEGSVGSETESSDTSDLHGTLLGPTSPAEQALSFGEDDQTDSDDEPLTDMDREGIERLKIEFRDAVKQSDLNAAEFEATFNELATESDLNETELEIAFDELAAEYELND